MKKITFQKWIIAFFASVFAILILLSGIVYIIDPFFQFRIKDDAYMLNARFANGGLIKNYDYDTLIIGSSMTQNFEMELFREKLGVQPLHVGLGGITFSEINELMDLAYKTGKADNFFICVDLPEFGNGVKTSRNPHYLLNNDFLSKCRYFLSYEVWFAFIPVDSCFMLLDGLGVKLPIKFEYRKSIDRLGDWRLDYSFGEEVVLNNFKNKKYAVSTVDIENLYLRMTADIDYYLSNLKFEAGEHSFFFPPYSALYWCNAQDNDYFDVYMDVKNYFIERASDYGAIVYDFQSADLILDLNNYKDTAHYSPDINNWMTECFANHEHITTKQSSSEFQAALIERTDEFRSTHAELFY